MIHNRLTVLTKFVIIILNGTILNISNPSNLYPSLIGNNVNDIINNIDKNKKKFKISDL